MQCSVCAHDNPAGNRFCGQCGAKLLTIASPPTRQIPLGAGEIKHVTVLFSDLVQSTELVAGLDAETAMESLQPVLQLMCQAVEHFGGTVVSTLGDGIMALFGAPRAQEGHAVRASHAALAIRDDAGLRAQNLSVRSGLHSGDVVFEPSSSPGDGSLSAYGVVLHLASRLPSQVDPQEICLTEPARALLGDDYETRSIGVRALRGVPGLVLLHLLVGPKSTLGDGPRSVAAPLVGRDREMARLRQILEASGDPGSNRNIVAITGPPGAGKSRLCHEFAVECRARGIAVDVIRAQPYGTATPLQPMMEFLRAVWLRLGPNDPADLSARRVTHALADLGVPDWQAAAIVCDFLGIPGQRSLPPWLNPRERVARLIEIIRAIVRRRGVTRSVLILEDLHWLDEASEPFVAALAEAASATRCLLVVNGRPGHDRPWMDRLQAQRIDLAELDQQDADALVESLIGTDPSVAELRRRIVARSGGNPFFAEELVRTLQGQGVITGEIGAFRQSETTEWNALPPTVQAVIGARIDSLPTQARRVLQTAAIIGQSFHVDILHAVFPLEKAVLTACLASLCEDGLLTREADAASASHSFRHPLIKEVAYSTQLRARRVPLHGAIARAMELLDGAQEAIASLIAYHYEHAKEPGLAAAFAAHAARWLGPRSSAEATRFWHKVRGLIVQERRSPAADKLRIEANGQIAWVGWREGLTSAQAQPFVEEALGLARETNDQITPLLMQVEGRINQVNGGSADAFVQQITQAIRLAEASNDAGRVATLQAALSHAYGWAGLLHQALAASDAAFAGIESVSDFDHLFLGYSVQHWAAGLRGRILLRLGRFDEATLLFDSLININELIDPTVQFIGHLGYVDLAWCTDDPAMAKLHAARIGALADRHGSSYLRAYHQVVDAVAAGVSGDPAAAVAGMTKSLQHLVHASTTRELEPEVLAGLAEQNLLLGDAGAALRAAEDAIALADHRSTRLPGIRARISAARALLQLKDADPPERSERLLMESERLIEECGATIYQRLWREGRSDLERCLKSREQAAPRA